MPNACSGGMTTCRSRTFLRAMAADPNSALHAALEACDTSDAEPSTVGRLEAELSSMSAEGEFRPSPVRVAGLRLVHRMRLGRGLHFLTLREAGGRTIEGVVRQDVIQLADGATGVGDVAALGDAVTVAGLVERSKGRLSLHIRTLSIDETWAELFGPKTMFHDDGTSSRHDNAPEQLCTGNLLCHCVTSHVERLRVYLQAAYGVEALGVVRPAAGPKCAHDERCLMLRAADAAALARTVRRDPVVARFIHRWYVVDTWVPTLAAAADEIATRLRGRALEANQPLPLHLRVHAFPKSMERALLSRLRASGTAEPEPQARVLACAVFVAGAVGLSVVSMDAFGVEGGITAEQRAVETGGPSASSSSVCRAFHKLNECAARCGLRLGDAAAAIDVGASPGGWTCCLADAGVGQIAAIDPGALALPEPLASSGRVEHMRMKAELAFEELERRGVKTLFDCYVCDMNDSPAVAVSTLELALPLLAPSSQVVLTFKNTFRRAADWRDALAASTERLSACATSVEVVHLLSNTAKEVTAVCRLRGAAEHAALVAAIRERRASGKAVELSFRPISSAAVEVRLGWSRVK